MPVSPISFLGSHLLALAYPLTLFSALFYYLGYSRRHAGMVRGAQRATIVVFALLTLSVILLVTAFVAMDYGLLYVAHYSSRSLPLFFKFTGLWAGLDGSILLWVWLVSLYSVIVLAQNHKRNPDWMPSMNGVFMAIVFFFLSMILFANNPFTPNHQVVADGKGLNPLLQNIAMVFHPPSLYLGYTGMAVPFAFAVGALISRRLDSSWIDASRRWTLVAWFFLTLGNILGAAWAYVELGWGGFWAWDPVENAAIMPWFTATAYIHSVMIQKRRGMLMIWNMVLVLITFILTLFGTFLTRSGVVQSVHAFSDSALGPYFLLFLGLCLIYGVYLILSRLSDLKSAHSLESLLSKESAFILNNILFVLAAVCVLWGTMFPTLSEAVTGDRITIGAPFFNKMMAPLGLALLALMGAGPMISWKKATAKNLKGNLLIPFIIGLIAGLAVIFVGYSDWYTVSTAVLCVFVLMTIAVEFYRGTKAMKLQKNLSLIPGLAHLISFNNRRYGGYLVHIGVVMIFLAIGGAVFKNEADFSLKPGGTYSFGGYTFSYVKPEIESDEHSQDYWAIVDVIKNEKKVATLKPAKFFYLLSQQPTTEVAIHHEPLRDVYLIIGNMFMETGQVDFRATINPLISFMWIGGLVILFGAVVVLLPRGFGFKETRAVVVFLALSCFLSSSAYAEPHSEAEHMGHQHDAEHIGHQHGTEDPFQNMDPNDPAVAAQKEIGDKLNCMCGDCVRTSLRTCTCSFAKKEREKLLKFIKEGKSDQEIADLFKKEYGAGVMVVPESQGFFKTAYFMPPLLALLAGTVGFLLFHFFIPQKKGAAPQPAESGTNSAENPYREQFEKELKDFDD